MRMFGYMLPEGLLDGRPRWDVKLVPAPADSERAVEIPWAASAVAVCFGLWLDVGYAYADPRYWRAISTKTLRRHLRYGYGLDLVSPQHQDPLPIHVVGDVVEYNFRTLPRFDLITCISTLEHVGCDNRKYHPTACRRDEPFELQKRAMRQLLTALTRRGRLLITLPYGAFQDHGWFLQYDALMVQTLTHVAALVGRRLISERYYQLTPEGWRRANAERLGVLGYRSEEERASAVALLEFGP